MFFWPLAAWVIPRAPWLSPSSSLSHRVLGLCSFVAPGQRPKLLRHLATFIYLQLLRTRKRASGQAFPSVSWHGLLPLIVSVGIVGR